MWRKKARMITVKKKEWSVDVLREVNLCETSLGFRELVLEVGNLEDSDESVIVHLWL